MSRPKRSSTQVLVACALLVSGSALAQQAPESPETERERAAALAAERSPRASSGALSVEGAGAAGPLFVGVDDAAIPAYRIDPTIPASVPVALGVQIWGAAYDSGSGTVYICSGSQIHSWVVGAPGTTLIGTITDSDTGATLSMVSLAFTGGTLYATRNIGTEGLYSIDTATAVATLVAVPSVPTGDIDTGGLAAHPVTGVLYATNDDTSFPGGGAGLVTFALDGTVTFVAAYPPGETDLDGLAIGTDGRAYLVEDDSVADSGLIHVYDLVGGDYETPIPTSWPTTETFSAGAWIDAGACLLQLTCPADVVALAPPGALSAPVSYAAPAVGGTCTDVTTSCAPPSGAAFPVGETTVACSAIDGVTGATAECTFQVSVTVGAAQAIPAASSLGLAALALLLAGGAVLLLRRR